MLYQQKAKTMNIHDLLRAVSKGKINSVQGYLAAELKQQAPLISADKFAVSHWNDNISGQNENFEVKNMDTWQSLKLFKKGFSFQVYFKAL